MKIQYSVVLLLTIFSYANGISVTTGNGKFERAEVIFKDPDDSTILTDTDLTCTTNNVIADAEGKTVLWECAAGYAHSWTNSDQLPYECNSYSGGDMQLKNNGKECMKQGIASVDFSDNVDSKRITTKAACFDLKKDIAYSWTDDSRARSGWNAGAVSFTESDVDAAIAAEPMYASIYNKYPKGCSWHPSPYANSATIYWYAAGGDSVADKSGKYAINIFTDCNAPASTTGYDVSGLTATFASWDSTSVSCATGYGGTASVTKCSAIGQPYSLSGCMKSMGQYSTLGSGFGTSVLGFNSATSWTEATGTHEIYCKSDSTIVTDNAEALKIQCKPGYLSADLALFWDNSVNVDVRYTTAYSCNPTTGALVVSSSGTCQASGCTDSAASNYASSAVYLDFLYRNNVDGTVCQYDETDKCAQYQSNKISGICIKDGRSVANALSHTANTPTTVKTAGCSSGATTCSAVSAVGQLAGVKINGDNDAYCVSGALKTSTMGTASQACDTANYYFKNGDSANTAGTISGYTCSGTTVSAPTGTNYNVKNSGNPTFTPSAVSNFMASGELPDGSTIAAGSFSSSVDADASHGNCEAILAAMITAGGTKSNGMYISDQDAALTKFEDITGFDIKAAATAAGKSITNIKTQIYYVNADDTVQAWVNGAWAAYNWNRPQGCSVNIKSNSGMFALTIVRGTGEGGGTLGSGATVDCSATGAASNTYLEGHTWCIDLSSPPTCEAVGAGVTTAMQTATNLDGSESCETGSTDFNGVACNAAGGYTTVDGNGAGYSCNNGAVQVTNECKAKCSDASVTGYTGTLNNLFVSTFNGDGVSCDTHFHGVASASVCSGAGAQPTYSGCDADECSQGLPTGYAFASDSQGIFTKHGDGIDVTTECASTHLQTGTLSASCDITGNELGGDLSFTANGNTDYTVVGYTGGDPQLKLCKGETYNIIRTEAGHALQIKKGGVGSPVGATLLSADATDSSSQTWTPTSTGAHQYYCVMHPDMVGAIDVVDCDLQVNGCSPKATIDSAVDTGTQLSSGGSAVDVSKLVCDGTTVKVKDGAESMAAVTAACKTNYKSDSVAVECNATNHIVNAGTLCAPECNLPGDDMTYNVADGNANTNTVSFNLCYGVGGTAGSAPKVDSLYLPAGCFDDGGTFKFNEHEDSNGNPSGAPCNSAYKCKQYTTPGYRYGTPTSVVQGSVAWAQYDSQCAGGYSGDFTATCPGSGQDLVFSGCTKTPLCIPSSNALVSECVCNGGSSCAIGKFCDVDGCSRHKACPTSFYTAVAAGDLSDRGSGEMYCNCGSYELEEGDFCGLNAAGARVQSSRDPCTAGAGSNSAECFCPSSSSNPQTDVGDICTPSGDNDVYCYDKSTDNSGMTCNTDALNKPDDFMLEDPGEVTTTDQDTWMVSHASCGAGKFNNLKRSSTLGFNCVACDRTDFLNNYNAPYGVKAVNVDNKDTLRREASMNDKKNVVHGKCCVNPHHSVCAEMIKEYKSKCEASLVMDNDGAIVDEVSKGTGVQCLDSTDADGNYDCVMGPNNAVCQNGGTPTGKMVDGCTCTCPSGYSGANCQVTPTCTNDVAITSLCKCDGSDVSNGSCDNNGYNPVCVEGGLLKDMAGDTCVCIDTVGNSISVVYKTSHNSESTSTCTNGNVA